MEYLKNYNLSDEQINDLYKILEEQDVIDTFKYEVEKVTSILDLFTSIGVRNIYDIIVSNPLMFLDTVSSIKSRIDKFDDTNELARLLNEDSTNLSLVGLL